MSHPIQPKSFFRQLLESTSTGGAAGTCAAFTIMPMITRKNMAQQAAKNPDGFKQTQEKIAKMTFAGKTRFHYRGVGGFAASFAPTIALQTVATKGFLESGLDPLSASIAGGATSALFVTPAEQIMIYQGKNGLSFWKATTEIHAKHGLGSFQNAFIPTAIREGLFVAGYLALPPLLKKEFEENGAPPLVAKIGASATSGLLATAFSHPFDTYKTNKQSNFSFKEPMVKEIFSKSAWKGFEWRLLFLTTAIMVMSEAQARFKPHIEHLSDVLSDLKI